ncbi:MAG: hypothetical protein ABIH23_07330, partial [bacterium]
NGGSSWQWAQMDFPIGSLDLTGMRELHMWVYILPDSVPHPDFGFEVRIDLPGSVTLGYQRTEITGEWVELVWPIDRQISQNLINDVSYFGGYIAPREGDVSGAMYIDSIYAVRPAGIVDLEDRLVYGFNEEPLGWKQNQGIAPALGSGDVTASEGANYMECALTGGWAILLTTTDAKGAFGRWPDVVEISVDVQLGQSISGGWAQMQLVLQTNDKDWDNSYPELSYADAVGKWKTLTWQVDMTAHAPAFERDDGWFIMDIISNNGAADEGVPIYLDNFRVAVPVGPELDSGAELVYGFNEASFGWNKADGVDPVLGQGGVTPVEGANYMEIHLGGGWTNNVVTSNARGVFNRWAEVVEMRVDVSLPQAPAGWGVQSALVIQSSANGWDQYSEMGYGDAVGAWKTLVWQVDMSKHEAAFTDPNGWFQILFTTNNGSEDDGLPVYFDYFRVVLAGPPEIETETELVYGFNEADFGWAKSDGPDPALGQGNATPAEGTNYLEVYLTEGWTNNIVTLDARGDFDRWAEVLEIMVDVQVSQAAASWGIQSALIIQSSATSWDQYDEMAYKESVGAWKTIAWEVDMSKHAAAFTDPNGWFQILITTNNGAEDAGLAIYFDNFRVAVPVSPTGVSDWSVF